MQQSIQGKCDQNYFVRVRLGAYTVTDLQTMTLIIMKINFKIISANCNLRLFNRAPLETFSGY